MKYSPKSNKSPLLTEKVLKDSIIFEDGNIIVINKPGWLVCHPSKNGPWSSLVGAVKEYLRLDRIFLVGRLDRETSGVVLIAKNQKTGRDWQMSLEKHKLKRTYLTIVEGNMRKCCHVTGFIGKDPYSKVFVKQRVAEQSRKSKRAETLFYPILEAGGFTLVSVITKTGRKHQIRVHSQSIGFPLVGEKLYGHNELYYLEFCQSGWNSRWINQLGMSRQALHARRFGSLEEGKVFEAEIPDDFQNFMKTRMDIKISDFKEILKKIELIECQELSVI